MRYKIAVCDDSEKDRAYISSFVKRWAGDTGHCVQIQEFCSAESFLFHYAQEKDFHILLLDIEMGAMDGVTMARWCAFPSVRSDTRMCREITPRSMQRMIIRCAGRWERSKRSWMSGFSASDGLLS